MVDSLCIKSETFVKMWEIITRFENWSWIYTVLDRDRTTLDWGRFYSVDESRDFVHSPGSYYGSNMTGLWEHHLQFPFPVVLFLSMGSLLKRRLSGFLLGTQSWSAVDLWKFMLLWPSLFFPKIVLGGQLGNFFYIT